jgi:hypothetical protein
MKLPLVLLATGLFLSQPLLAADEARSFPKVGTTYELKFRNESSLPYQVKVVESLGGSWYKVNGYTPDGKVPKIWEGFSLNFDQLVAVVEVAEPKAE